MTSGFVPPPYPQDRLKEIRKLPAVHGHELVDLSIGTPVDPVPAIAMELGESLSSARGYPSSAGSAHLREAAATWIGHRFDVEVGIDAIGACVGSKEFVSSLPQYLRLRDPSRSTVLYPAVSYPTYAMGATLAGCNAVAVPISKDGELDLDSLSPDVLKDTLCCWVNSPANPTGQISGFDRVVEMGREHGFVVVSDECYVEFAWASAPATVLEYGPHGVLALHSLSKRSNFAGGRVGFYAGDQSLVSYLSEVRKHAGLMVPGPIQIIAAALLQDQEHVDVQRALYRERLEVLIQIATALGFEAKFPEGGFYIWVDGGELDGFELAATFASRTGIVGSPGEFYGDASKNFLRIAAVAPTNRLASIAASLL